MRVCILGSGLTTLTLAKALVNQKIFVDIISKNKKYKINYSRTIGISKSNYEYFKRNIINIEKIIWKLKKIEIYSDNLKKEKILNFENKENQLFSIIKIHHLYDVLNKSLLKNKYFNKIIFEKKNSIKFDNYNLIINTDYNSTFTKKYFSKKIEKIYNSTAYTTIINHETISNDTAIQIFTKLGPLAFLPFSQNKTSIVYSVDKSKSINKKQIIQLIKQYNSKYKIKKIKQVEKFELKSLNLRSYYHKNILAFGDLLHKIHPLAGQGFNMTIRDIKILLEIINNKQDLALPINSSVCKEFENKSKHKNFIFSNGIDFINKFFYFERKSSTRVLSKSVQIFGKNMYVNKFLKRIADKGFFI